MNKLQYTCASIFIKNLINATPRALYFGDGFAVFFTLTKPNIMKINTLQQIKGGGHFFSSSKKSKSLSVFSNYCLSISII